MSCHLKDIAIAVIINMKKGIALSRIMHVHGLNPTSQNCDLNNSANIITVHFIRTISAFLMI